MAPRPKFDFQPELLPDNEGIKVVKPYMESLNLTVMEMEILSRYTILRQFRSANGDHPFWIFEDSTPVRVILQMAPKL